MTDNPGTELQTVDYVPSFAVTLDEAAKRLEQFREFVNQQMKEGEDFGVIPGTSKPTLLKPGAEKLCNIFGFAPHYIELRYEEDWETGLFAYTSMCSLVNKRTGQIEAECIASCNSKESKYRFRWEGKGRDRKKVENDDTFSLVNTLQKMAQKRALVGAVLTATRASGIFTQDMEDLDNGSSSPKASKKAKPAKEKKPLDASTRFWSFVKEHDIEDKTARAFLKEFDNDCELALPHMKERLGFDEE